MAPTKISILVAKVTILNVDRTQTPILVANTAILILSMGLAMRITALLVKIAILSTDRIITLMLKVTILSMDPFMIIMFSSLLMKIPMPHRLLTKVVLLLSMRQLIKTIKTSVLRQPPTRTTLLHKVLTNINSSLGILYHNLVWCWIYVKAVDLSSFSLVIGLLSYNMSCSLNSEFAL